MDIENTKWKAAAYLRLSREDGDKEESDSITNQRAIIGSFCEGRGYPLVEEYVDDGFSGSNFDRPSFKNLLQDIKIGKVNCIVVKDLSRFGRNLVEAGKYIENLFPAWGVRFISIHDFYDTEKDRDASSTLTIAFKNLINEMYCRDISIKIKATFDMKRRNGDFIGSIPPYGYFKDPDHRGKLIIDEAAAMTIRMIFDLKMDGMNQKRIAQYLNMLEVPTPSMRLEALGIPVSFYENPSTEWHQQTVTRVLTNELYIGTMVQGKVKKASYKKKELVRVAKENWIRVENAAPPIVEKRIFEYVQDLMVRDSCTPKGETHVSLFSGIARCGDCGQNMSCHKTEKNGRVYTTYVCAEHLLKKNCSYHRIREDKLMRAVASAMREQIEYLLLLAEKLKEKESMPSRRFATTSIDERIRAAVAEVSRCRENKGKAYEDHVLGLIDKDTYQSYAEMYGRKMRKAEDEIEHLQSEREKLVNGRFNLIPWIESLREFRNFREMTRRMVVTMVQDIFVYEGGRVKVVFRYADQIADLVEMLLEEGEAMELEKNKSISIDRPVITYTRRRTLPPVIPYWKPAFVDSNGVEIGTADVLVPTASLAAAAQ